MTSVDVDKSGASYYGEQGLLFLSARGDGNLVVLGECGRGGGEREEGRRGGGAKGGVRHERVYGDTHCRIQY